MSISSLRDAAVLSGSADSFERSTRRTSITPTYQRLIDAIRAADRHHTIQAMRTRYGTALAEYTGRFHAVSDVYSFASIGLPKSPLVPADLHGLRPDSPLGEMCRTWLPYLSAGGFRPKVVADLTTERFSAAIQTQRLRQVCADCNMERVAWELVLDSLLSMSVARVHVFSDAVPQPFGATRYDKNQPYTRRVPLHNWIPDPTCEGDLTRAMYIAERYVVDRGELLDRTSLPANIRARIEACANVWERSGDQEELYTADLIELIDVEFVDRGTRYTATLPHWDDSSDPEGWIVEPMPHAGPEHESAFVQMVMGFAPGFLEGLSPAATMMDAHIATTVLAARGVEEGFTARRYTIADPSARAIAAALSMPVMDAVVYADPKGAQEATRGGLVAETVQAHGFALQLAQRKGPNMMQGRGFGSGSDTATGETINAGNVETIMTAWRDMRNSAFSGILARMGWWLNALPKPPVKLNMTLPNGKKVPILYDPSMPIAKDLSWQSLQYTAITGATSSMDPRMRQRSLVELMPQIPMWVQTVAQLGGNIPAALDLLAEFFEIPELGEIIPTENTEAIIGAVRSMIEQNSMGNRGGPVATGGDTRQAQMQSDYAPAMAGQ